MAGNSYPGGSFLRIYINISIVIVVRVCILAVRVYYTVHPVGRWKNQYTKAAPTWRLRRRRRGSGVAVTVKIIDFDGTRDDDYFSFFFSAIFRPPAAVVSLLFYVFLCVLRPRPFPPDLCTEGKKCSNKSQFGRYTLHPRARDVTDTFTVRVGKRRKKKNERTRIFLYSSKYYHGRGSKKVYDVVKENEKPHAAPTL